MENSQKKSTNTFLDALVFFCGLIFIVNTVSLHLKHSLEWSITAEKNDDILIDAQYLLQKEKKADYIVKRLKTKYALKSVTLTMSGFTEFQLSNEKRKALAGILHNENFWLIDKSGEIFGKSSKNPVPITVLSLFSKTPSKNSSTGLYESQLPLHSLITLIASTSHLKISTIKSLGERGYSFFDGKTEIYIGDHDYQRRLKDLSKIYKKYTKDKIAKVELDYKDKAFVKMW